MEVFIMKKGLTELVFVIDMSGSMYDLTADTIGGFNSMLDKQKAVEGEAYVTTVLFNDDKKVLHDRVNIKDVKPMTENEYRAGGCTALNDALGSSIRHIAGIHKYARKEDIPEHTIFVITTDGMENASHKYSAARVKEMVEHEKSKYGWEFILLGANIDAIETAGNLGIDADRASNYVPDPMGTTLVFSSIDDAMLNMRMSRPVKAEWKSNLEADHKKRGNK